MRAEEENMFDRINIKLAQIKGRLRRLKDDMKLYDKTIPIGFVTKSASEIIKQVNQLDELIKEKLRAVQNDKSSAA